MSSNEKDSLRFVKRHHEAAVNAGLDGKLAYAVNQLCYAVGELIRWATALEKQQGTAVRVQNKVYPPEAEKCPTCGEMAKEFQPFFSPDEEGGWYYNNSGIFLCPKMHPWKYEGVPQDNTAQDDEEFTQP